MQAIGAECGFMWFACGFSELVGVFQALRSCLMTRTSRCMCRYGLFFKRFPIKFMALEAVVSGWLVECSDVGLLGPAMRFRSSAEIL